MFVPILVGACSVGTYGETMQGTDGSTMGGDDRNVCVTKEATPLAAHNHVADGANPAGARAGMGCIAAGTCHGPASPTLQFTFAGTAYKEVTNPATPAAGVTIRFFARGGMKSLGKVVTDDAGNFYTSQMLTFPLETDITGCASTPSEIVPMIAPLASATEGNCSSSAACHLIPGPRPIFLQGS